MTRNEREVLEKYAERDDLMGKYIREFLWEQDAEAEAKAELAKLAKDDRGFYRPAFLYPNSYFGQNKGKEFLGLECKVCGARMPKEHREDCPVPKAEKRTEA